eukprot:scaffold21632_cov62-Phaeocystis_antarctica.AAC.8
MGLAAESSRTISMVGVTTFEHSSLELLLDQAPEHDALAVATLTSDAAPPSCVISVQSKSRTSAIAKTLYLFQSSSAAGEKLKVAFAQATLEIYGGDDGGHGGDGGDGLEGGNAGARKPPPQAQHMTLAVKSSSSPIVEPTVIPNMPQLAGGSVAQLIIVMLMAPLSVSVHGGVAGAGGAV